MALDGVETVEEQNVRTAFLSAGGHGIAGGPEGSTDIELLEAVGSQGPVAAFIAARGEGVHHLAFLVDDLEAALAECQAAGIRLIDREPRRGAGGSRIAFIHPQSAHGVLVELCERMA